MASQEERGEANRKKTWKTGNEVPAPRSRTTRSKNEKPVDAINRKDPTPPRSRSAPNKERPQPTNANRNTVVNNVAKLSPPELEKQLQDLLTSGRYEDAANWVKGSTYLSEKFKLADIVRLVLDQRQFDLAGRLIREHKLADNQQLVTFFIMELVRSGRFHLAVRYSQELIPNFNNEGNSSAGNHPMWTPTTLIMAMIRVQQYKSALKYTKQFGLENEFPIKKFVQGLIHEKMWLDAFTVIMEHKLDDDFSINVLIDNLLRERQWSAAIKCIKMGKRSSIYTAKVLVLRMIQSGDFLSSLQYLKEFELTEDLDLVRHMLNSMLHYGEYYKALKYSIKYGLASEPRFNPARLIEVAIDHKRYHVALLYIKKLKLESQFEDDMRHIAHEKDELLVGFRNMMARKRQRQRSPEYQAKLKACLGDNYEEPEETEIVISVEEEIVKPPSKPSFLERLRNLDDSSQSLSGLNFSFEGLSGLGSGSSSFADIDRAFADVDRSFAFNSQPVRSTSQHQPPLPVQPQQTPLRTPPPPPPPQAPHYFTQPPLPNTAPPLPPGGLQMQPPLPPPPPLPQSYYGYQPPLPSTAASLAMQFHVHQPPPPPGPPLPPQPPKTHRTFVPSLSLKPSHIGQKH